MGQVDSDNRTPARRSETAPRSARGKMAAKYKRTHSALNTKVIIPAFHIRGGKVVGGGQDAALPVDPLELVKSFGIVGEVLVVNDDAAAGVDSAESDKMMDRLLDSLPCRLSGGFTTNARVYDWLDKGASHVVVEYAASNLGFLDGVPKERITIAVTVTGSAGEELQIAGGGAGTLQAAMDEIRYYGTRLLVSFDGALDRSAVETAKALTDTAKGLMLNVQDPLSADDVAYLDAKGIESILDEPLKDGSMTIASALGAVLVSDRPDGLIPTVVVDEDLVSLGLCYSNHESLAEAFKRCVGVYWSRTRGLWIKGLTSGATQELLRIDLDCDRDSMRFVVRQAGAGFCHMGISSCFGEDHGSLGALMRTLIDRRNNAPAGSYTKRLFDDEALLKSKLLEECEELMAAKDNREVAFETADVVYFAFAACARHGVNLAAVQRSLARKALRVRRRPGNAKPAGWKPGDPSPDAAVV